MARSQKPPELTSMFGDDVPSPVSQLPPGVVPDLLLESDEVSAATRKMRMLRSLVCGGKYERQARAGGATMVAGVDEVGRGSLFGCVVAAAVILPVECRIRGLRDSKQLLREDRERLAEIVKRKAIAPATCDIRFGRDPVGACAVWGSSPYAWAEMVPAVTGAIKGLAAMGFNGPFAAADGRVIHDAGGSEAQELAFVLATPVSSYFMHRWLENYVYRITLGPGVFAVTIMAAVGIAWATVGYRAVRAALASPARSLRSE